MTSNQPIGASAEVVVRCADAGDTYLTWTWTRGPLTDRLGHPAFKRIAAAELGTVMDQLAESLMPDGTEAASLAPTAHKETITERLRASAMMQLGTERELSGHLGDVILPDQLAGELCVVADSGTPITVRVTPSTQLSHVPWELLPVSINRRLLDVATIITDPPAAAAANRASDPRLWDRAGDSVYILDPRVPARSGLASVLDDTSRQILMKYLEEHAESSAPVDGRRVTRSHLSQWLRADEPPSRLFYVGHVTSEPSEPGSAALHLTDTVGKQKWGMAAAMGANSRHPIEGAHSDDHLPLSALDLLLGTQQCHDPIRRKQLTLGTTGERTPGHEIWPMPPRVAVIACEGGVDYRSVETFGLIMAILSSGAQMVTTTRWVLPTDHTMRPMSPHPTNPTTELIMAVDTAHRSPTPIATLVHWQRLMLAAWSDTGAPEYSPLIWSSLIHTYAP